MAFFLARSSRGLLLGEAAIPEEVEAIRIAIKSHPSVVEVTELLTMHLAPKQILVNAGIVFKDDLDTEEIVNAINEVEQKIKEAESTVDMIFLETASFKADTVKTVNPKHIG